MLLVTCANKHFHTRAQVGVYKLLKRYSLGYYPLVMNWNGAPFCQIAWDER